MGYKKRYKINQKRVKRTYFKIMVLCILVIAVLHSYARYISVIQTNSVLQLARWSIIINGELVSTDTHVVHQPAPLINTADGTTSIDQGDECYFDIIINPTSTETALTYEININSISENTTLPNETIIEKYEKYNGSNEVLSRMVTVNDSCLSIEEDIELGNNQSALTSDSIRKYRIFFVIPEHINVTKDQEYTVTPTVNLQQKIDSGL